MMTQRAFRHCAFTLLEMLLVVMILGMVASSMVLLLDERGDQARYDETKRRYEQIREAIFGPEGLTLNGSPVLRGYIADTGELPQNLRHLWVCPKEWRTDPNDPASAPKAFLRVGAESTIIPATLRNRILIYHGWRGPYVSFASATATGKDLEEADDDFRDGWGHRWTYQAYPGTTAPTEENYLAFRSLGRDGTEDPTPNQEFSADLPPTADQSKFLLSTFDTQDGSIPQIVIKDLPAGSYTLGVLYGGFLRMEAAYSASDLSIVTKPGGAKLEIPGDLVDENGNTGAVADRLPPGLTFKRNFGANPDARFPRQLQLVLYRDDSGKTFAENLAAVYPVVFTFLPRTAFVPPSTPVWRAN